MWDGVERRRKQHTAVHRLAQTYADLVMAEKEVIGLNDPTEGERKHRALCFIRQAYKVIEKVVNDDLGPKLIIKQEGV